MTENTEHNDFDKRFISPKLDVIFKMMFGDINNIDLLKSLLKTYLNIDEGGEYILGNTEITPDEIGDKTSRLDLCIIKGKKLINVEVQVNNDHNFKKRSLYYWSKLNASLLKEGDEYEDDNLDGKSAHSLNIMDFVLFPEDEHFFNKCYVQNTYQTIAFDEMMQMAYVELPKLRGYTPEQLKSDDRIAWAALFKAKNEEEIDMLSNTTQNTDIQKAVAVLKVMNADERTREIARKRWESKFNERDALNAEYAAGKAEGKAEGIEIGAARERKRTIQLLRSMGMSEEEIDIKLKEVDN